MTTNPGSIVSLIATDKRNSVNRKKDSKDLRPFLRAKESAKKIDSSNFFILTDAKVDKENCGERSTRSINDDDDDGEEEDKKLFRNEGFESWLFESIKADDDGKVTLEIEVPNTITSWHLSAISTHPDFEIIFSDVHEVEVSKQFFVKMILPLWIRVREAFKVDIMVFNYDPDQLFSSEVTVKFSADGDNKSFEFIEISECSLTRDDSSTKEETLIVEPNSQASISFMIRPLKSGPILFKVQTKTDLGFSDESEKMVKVLPDSFSTFNSHSMLIDLRNQQSMVYEFNLPIPEDAFRKTVEIEVVRGDLLELLLQDVASSLSL